jgi:hypothetical protein
MSSKRASSRRDDGGGGGGAVVNFIFPVNFPNRTPTVCGSFNPSVLLFNPQRICSSQSYRLCSPECGICIRDQRDSQDRGPSRAAHGVDPGGYFCLVSGFLVAFVVQKRESYDFVIEIINIVWFLFN